MLETSTCLRNINVGNIFAWALQSILSKYFHKKECVLLGAGYNA